MSFPSLISLVVFVDVNYHERRKTNIRAQELCESRGGRPGFPSLMNPFEIKSREAELDSHSRMDRLAAEL